MKGTGRLKLLLTLVMFVLIIALFASVALAQGGYNLRRGTVAGGGHIFSTNGGYKLGGTIGQAGAGAMSGDPYTLGSGFWGGGALSSSTGPIYLPIVVKN